MARFARKHSYGGYSHDFVESKPIEIKGGIKAQSRRGTFGDKWWARRWNQITESADIGSRLNRGKTYARKGQVISIEIDKGRISAKVQGSRNEAYEVLITMETLPKDAWKRLAARLAQQALFVARLMSGDLPKEIEDLFAQEDLTLFPEAAINLEHDCSCPEWENPCKHIIAIFLLVSEELDRNPFLLFKMRGIEREELLEMIHLEEVKIDKKKSSPSATSKNKPGRSKIINHPIGAPPPQTIAVCDLPMSRNAFWGKPHTEDSTEETASIPTMTAALPKRLGNFPFWRGDERFIETIEQIYATASTAGMEILLGDEASEFPE